MAQQSARGVASRAVSSSLFRIGGQAITLVTGTLRGVILARLLTPDDYGLVMLAAILANLVWNTTMFGIDSRLVQKPSLSNRGLTTHLALRVSLSILAFLILLAAVPLINLVYSDREGLTAAVLAIAAVNVLIAFNMTPYVLLKRELAFRRLVVIDVVSSLTMLITASLLAWQGWGFWALILGEYCTGALVSTLGLWVFRRPMRFSFRVDWALVKDYLGFGKFVMLTHQLNFLLNRFDEFWAGTALGQASLGYYTKAYEFASYPNKIIANPLQDVLFSTYSRLQNDRLNLSKAFFRANSYVVRAGFLFTSVLLLVSPEFVRIILGEKWLPMLSAFQLMAIYSLVNPLLLTSGNLLTACGVPQKATKIRALQAFFFVPAVVAGAAVWGINGIALATNGMLLVGLLSLFRMTREYIDLSVRRLLGPPILGLVAGGMVVTVLSLLVPPLDPLLWALSKATAFSLPYLATLLLLEGKDYQGGLRVVLQILKLPRFWDRSEESA